MWTQDLVRDCVFTRVQDAVAAGQGTTNTSGVDMSPGWDGVLFLVGISGSLNTAVVTVGIQESSTAIGSGYGATISSSNASYTNSSGSTQKGLIGAQIYRPLLRFCRAAIVTSTANSAIDLAIAIQWRGRANPAALITNFLAQATAAGV